jgi:hypothetical protein
MTKKISDTKPIIEFIDVATRFCMLIENRDEKTGIKLLQEAFIILPQLCLSGMRLPDIKRFFDYKETRMSQEQWNELYKSLERKFAKYDGYNEMFDPYDIEDQEPTYGTLSDDLSDIYRDIKPGLQGWEKVTSTERLAIIWHWQWGFENHWGDHATSVFRALYSLLYNHIENKNDDEYQLYIGIREER